MSSLIGGGSLERPGKRKLKNTKGGPLAA